MKPAVSIIFFTVSSGAGLGLLALIALSDTFAPESLPAEALWRGALLGLALVAIGLASSVLHLANPKNAWRSFARFKSSWLSREAVFSAALFPVSGLYIVLVVQSKEGASRILLALLACALAWVVLVCTAMIYASLKPIRQWHTRWTPVNYVLLGHWSGALLLWAIACAYAARSGPFLFVAGVFGLAALAAKLAYWHGIGDGAQPLTLERAIGVREGVHGPGPISAAHARLLDVGHSHGTSLTSEFRFELARPHARAFPAVALAAGLGPPLSWPSLCYARWPPALAAALCCIMGL